MRLTGPSAEVMLRIVEGSTQETLSDVGEGELLKLAFTRLESAFTFISKIMKEHFLPSAIPLNIQFSFISLLIKSGYLILNFFEITPSINCTFLFFTH